MLIVNSSPFQSMLLQQCTASRREDTDSQCTFPAVTQHLEWMQMHREAPEAITLSQIPATAASTQPRCQQGHKTQESRELGPVCVPGFVGVQASASPYHASALHPLWGISKKQSSKQLAMHVKQAQ